MQNKSKKDSPIPYFFKIYTDGCDDVLSIISRKRRGRPILIRYWTGNGVAAGLREWLPKRPGLIQFCREVLAGLEAELESDDPNVRAKSERVHELIAGLRQVLGSGDPASH